MTGLEWLGVLLTLAGVWLTARGNKLGWLAGICGSALYIYICFHARLYAESLLQGLYVAMGFYGLITWNRSDNEQFIVRLIPVSSFLLSLLVWLILLLAGGYFLQKYSDTDVPYSDATLAASGLVLTWQMAQRYLECWSGWIIVNLLSSAVFFYKQLVPTALLYIVLAALAAYGHYSWKKSCALP